MPNAEVILHILNKQVPPPINAGGTNRLLHWLASAQSREGHKVYVATPEGEDTHRYKNLRLPSNFTIDDLSKITPSEITSIEYHGGGDENVQDYLDQQPIPVLRTWHWVNIHQRVRKNTVFVSSSHARTHGKSRFIYNGIPINDYAFREKKDFFLFLAKVKRSNKGIEDAIAIAREARITLIIAGGRRLGSPHTWFKWHPRIFPVGFVDGEYKRKLLSEARALIVPIKWDEPFGLTMIEAMASGTPVIAYNRGAVPELIENGITGFICENREMMLEAIKKCKEIDPNKCRSRVEKFFSDDLMAKRHIEHLQEIRSGSIW
jgi:glycosyltransferase involved in cell wall biosynthesis